MMAKDQGGEAWLTPAQAAKRLGVTTIWVRRLSDRGDLEMQRTPLGRLISRESVERYAAKKDAGELSQGGRPPKKAVA